MGCEPHYNPELARLERRRLRLLKRAFHALLFSTILLASLTGWLWLQPLPDNIQGIFWQPTDDLPQPSLSCRTAFQGRVLIMQWYKVSDRTYHPPPNWPPRKLVAGLSSTFNLQQAWKNWHRHIDPIISLKPLAWYASLEISPDWRDDQAIHAYLSVLPRPLWVSVYHDPTQTPEAFAAWIKKRLPEDVYVLFQDGVGVGRTTPEMALRYFRALQTALGDHRVALVMELFHQHQGHFQPASPFVIWRQLSTYTHAQTPLYLFSYRHLTFINIQTLKLFGLLNPPTDVGSAPP